jgi:hypothetical protein
MVERHDACAPETLRAKQELSESARVAGAKSNRFDVFDVHDIKFFNIRAGPNSLPSIEWLNSPPRVTKTSSESCQTRTCIIAPGSCSVSHQINGRVLNSSVVRLSNSN